MMIDTVAALGESGRQLRNRYCFQLMMQPGEMKRTFIQQGLADVTETDLMIRMDLSRAGGMARPSAGAAAGALTAAKARRSSWS
jgi:hypothetical protein